MYDKIGLLGGIFSKHSVNSCKPLWLCGLTRVRLPRPPPLTNRFYHIITLVRRIKNLCKTCAKLDQWKARSAYADWVSSFGPNPFLHESVNGGWVSSFCHNPSSHEIPAVPLHRGNFVHPKNLNPRFGLFFASRTTPTIPLNQDDFSKQITKKIVNRTKSIETKGLIIRRDPIKSPRFLRFDTIKKPSPIFISLDICSVS